MKLPLYKEARNTFPKLKNKDNLNLGLYHQKFCNYWNNYEDLKLDKHSFMSDMVDRVKTMGISERIYLTEQIERLSFLTTSLGGESKIYELIHPFLTGSGINHPLEVGFLWNHTLGVPYIAGSSIKGTVRCWAEEWLEEKDETIERIFGSSTLSRDSSGSKVGSVIFFDALPYGRINLKVDVMTPHYSHYYHEGKVPGDWNNPTPIPFLTVDQHQKFIFYLAPRTEKDIEDFNRVLIWFEEALTIIGTGAKTAIGYGRFKTAEDDERAFHEMIKQKVEEMVRKQKVAEMTPIRREMESDGYSEDEEKFMRILTVKWLERLEDEDEGEIIKKEIAKHLADWYKKCRPKQWKKPTGKNIMKVKKIKSFIEMISSCSISF